MAAQGTQGTPSAGAGGPLRLYSEEWVAACNDALADLVGDGVAGAPAAAGAQEAAFRMLQVVHGGPDGTVRLALDVREGRATLEREPADEPAPQVTVSVRYDDALDLATGAAEPAKLLAAGRVKVRGDLAVLVAGQALLAAAAERLSALSERTTP